jgi:hypothetical protein
MAKLSDAELAKREEIIQSMKKNKRSLVKRYITDKKVKGEEPINPEVVMYGRATNIAKKVTETQMKRLNLKELVRAALMQEKAGFSKEFDSDPALKGGQKKLDVAEPKGKITAADFAMLRKGGINEMLASIIGRVKTYAEEKYPQLTDQDIKDFIKMHGQDIMGGSNLEAEFDNYVYQNFDLEEDLDLGHEDDEPHMLKSDLYHIGKYAMNLYQMVDQFEGKGEVDFPHWWQSKIIKAKEMMSSAKHYLDFELKEPEIDAAVDVIDASNALDNVGVDETKESLNEDLTSALTALIISIIAIPALPITGALIMGLIDYLFNDLPDQRAEAKSLRSYKGPDKQEKALALAKEIESKLSPGKKRYLKALVNRIGAAKLEDKAKEYRELDRYASAEKSRMDRGLDENLKTDIESALEDLPVPNVGINDKESSLAEKIAKQLKAR